MGYAALFTFVWFTQQDAEHARLASAASRRLAERRHTRIVGLERELTAALAHHENVREFVSERVAAEAADRRAREERLLAATRKTPEGIRLAFDALHDLLRRSGHSGLRFLTARAIADKELLGVELFEAPGAVRPSATLWLAERVAFRLDRATSTLAIRLRDGRVIREGTSVDLPEAGEPLLLMTVDGPAFERELPYLVVAEGEYPQPEPTTPTRARLDPFTAESWRDRLNGLLESASTPFRYRVTELVGLENAEFVGVVLLGQSTGKRLEQMAEVERLAVVVDEGADTVELELIGGVFHRAGGDTVLPARAPGQRILLPGVTPQAAARALTGMVVRR